MKKSPTQSINSILALFTINFFLLTFSPCLAQTPRPPLKSTNFNTFHFPKNSQAQKVMNDLDVTDLSKWKIINGGGKKIIIESQKRKETKKYYKRKKIQPLV
jgi:hypothetical protein